VIGVAFTLSAALGAAGTAMADPDGMVIHNEGQGQEIAPTHVAGELIVKFTQLPTDGALAQVQQAFPEIQSWRALQHAPHYKDRPGVPHPLAYYRVANIPVDLDDLALAQQLEQSEGIVSAQRNGYVYIAYVPNDPMYNQQYGPQLIESEDAWDITQGGSEVVVAVTDTGLNFGHEDLSHAVWTNPGEIPANGLDDDNNGFIDDWRGYDFNGNDADPTDGNGHGSHVSGSIAAGLSNSKGIAGMSRSTIMAVQIWSSGGSGTYEDMAEGLYYCVDNGAHVVNTSGGGSTNLQMYEEAATYAWDNGVSQVAAAHNWNSNTKCYPAAYPEVVSVAATDSNDNRAWFSNYGDWITVAAPGVDVISCYRGATNSYSTLSGTSMASPHTAGLVALMVALDPGITPQEVFDLLEENSVDLGSPGFDIYYGWGRIDAYAALSAMGPSDCITLSVANLVAGQSATWTVTGVTPGVRAAVVWGTQGGTTNVNNYAGYCCTFDIQGVNNSKLIGQPTANGGGVATVSKSVPNNVSGLKVLMQAAEQNTCPNECVSNLLSETIG
jgi:subtilisin family serine protease